MMPWMEILSCSMLFTLLPHSSKCTAEKNWGSWWKTLECGIPIPYCTGIVHCIVRYCEEFLKEFYFSLMIYLIENSCALAFFACKMVIFLEKIFKLHCKYTNRHLKKHQSTAEKKKVALSIFFLLLHNIYSKLMLLI